MNCQEFQKSLEQIGNGEVCLKDSAAFRLHLNSCAGCASRLSASDWVEFWPAFEDSIEPSEDFAARFHARLRERQHSKRRAGLSWWSSFMAMGWPKQLLAAGSVAALIATGIFLAKYGSSYADRSVAYGEFLVAENLPLLQDMAVINNLDMLEDFDTIENLPPRPAGDR